MTVLTIRYVARVWIGNPLTVICIATGMIVGFTTVSEMMSLLSYSVSVGCVTFYHLIKSTQSIALRSKDCKLKIRILFIVMVGFAADHLTTI